MKRSRHDALTTAACAKRKNAAGALTTTKLATGGEASSPNVSAASATPKLSELSEEEITQLFVNFVNDYQKTYEDEDEAAMRMEIFRRNLKRIDDVRFFLGL